MGNFYINIAVKGATPELLRSSLSELSYPSIVLPDIDGHAFVYADFFNAGDMQAPVRLAKRLSEDAKVAYAIVSMNADDDLYNYEIWKNGSRVDAYFSNPEMFQPDQVDSTAPRGNPTNLRKIFPFLVEQEVREILDNEDYVFAFERHQDLFRLLKLPADPAIMDYNYIQNGELPDGITEDQLIRFEPRADPKG